jgi:hypothetical protein
MKKPSSREKKMNSRLMMLVVLLTLVLFSTVPTPADQHLPVELETLVGGEYLLQGGAWHFKSIPCVDTTVLSVSPRISVSERPSRQDFEQSGVVVEFQTRLGYGSLFPEAHAGVTHYQGASNDIMIAEHAGDRVQVCFLGTPLPSWNSHGDLICDPDNDDRGRTYRVYDYRLHAAYAGMNSEHACGGA